MKLFILLFSFFSFFQFGWAVDPSEKLDNSVLEQRARGIYKELRCMVCRNENIDSSDAELAKDLRQVVRERLLLGSSNKDIISYIEERYGEYVLFKPKFAGANIFLWILAPLTFVIGLFFSIKFIAKGSRHRNEFKN